MYLQKKNLLSFLLLIFILIPQKTCSMDLEKVLKRELPMTEKGIPVIRSHDTWSRNRWSQCFNFPPETVLLKKKKRLIAVTEGPPPFEKRITCTSRSPLFLLQGERWFLVTGHDKKEILGKIFKDIDRELPAAKISSFFPFTLVSRHFIFT